jgi:regulatory protein
LADSDANRAYLAGLQLLAARELSEAQVRSRLARRRFDDHQIDDAVQRLRREGALDDARTARAIAHSTAAVRGQGRRRARARLAAAGIDQATAAAAVDAVFGEIDTGALLQAALDRKLRGRTGLADAKEQARLFRYLVRQGFETDRIVAALRAVARKGSEDC